ncbi:hypothetical protein OPEN69S_01809 [Ottowia pentelensis]
MSRICPQCGAENRDSAKFCLKCAHQMVPLSAATEPAALEAPKRRRKRRPKAQPEAPRRRRMLLGAVVGVAVLAGLLLALGPWGTRADAPAPVAPPPALAAAQAAPPAPTAELVPAPESAALAQAAADLEPLQSPAAQPAASATPVADAAPAAKPAARRRPAKASPEPAPPPAPVVAQQAPEPPAPVPVLAPRPAPPRELCADKSFVARGYCMQTECSKPGMGSHPQCARMHEQQDAMRRGSGEG